MSKDETAGVGHNGLAADELRLLVERYERLSEEKKGIADDQKDVLAEAKSRGYDVKAMRFVVRQRAIAKERRDEERAMQELYLQTLGML